MLSMTSCYLLLLGVMEMMTLYMMTKVITVKGVTVLQLKMTVTVIMMMPTPTVEAI